MSDDQEQFMRFMEHNCARFSSIAAQWTSRLSGKDAEWFLACALETAWQRRGRLNPRRGSIVLWFERCCNAAALRRKVWRIQTINGPEWVQGRHLRRLP